MTIHVSPRVTLFWVDRSKECKDYRGKICLFARRDPGSTARFDCARPGDWHIASTPIPLDTLRPA